MTTYTKPLTEQKFYEILQSCKQISKDDRLYLRKLVKQGDQSIRLILSDFQSRKLQIRLRKYLQKCKETKKNQLLPNNRHNTKIDLKANHSQETPNNYRKALSLQKKCKKGILSSIQVKQFKYNGQQNPFQKMRASCGNLERQNYLNRSSFNSTGKFPINELNASPSVSFDRNWKIDNKFNIQNKYLRTSDPSIYTPVDFLKMDSMKLQNRLHSQTLSNISNSLALSSIHNRDDIQSFSSFMSKINCSSLAQKQQKSQQIEIHNFKSALIKYYAEDIFEQIVSNYFPLTINQKSVYFPYKQFLHQVQNYLRNKGQNIQIIRENDIKIHLFEPFNNEYQGVTLKNLGQFLNKLCLHKNNSIRSIFIVLGSNQNVGISLQKFKIINSWKGQQLMQAFQKLVKRWGQNNTITYWQAYRVKNQKQFINFNTLYSKI